jgi:hypothetical protein
MSFAMRDEWHIEDVRRERRDTASRVTASVNGHPVWFESADLDLRPVAEAFATLFFIPALDEAVTLHVEAELHPDWLSQTRKLLPIYNDWWNYPEAYPVTCAGRKASVGASGSHVGQCFTGGVDSFYTLLHGSHDASHLLYVQGYDMSCTDDQRMQALDDSLRAVASAHGKKVVRLRTNVREHPQFKKASWERTHGAALAAAGSVASGTLGRLIIPSSYAYADEVPWGSHWDTDPLWSLPGRLDVVHDDASRSRRDKILRMASHPTVQRHLRVCWENRSATGNCSQCEKCLRTMVLLEAAGTLPQCAVFDTETPLAERLDAASPVGAHLWFVWEDMMTRSRVKPAMRRAIRRLLRRSRLAHGKTEYGALARRGRRLWERLKTFV